MLFFHHLLSLGSNESGWQEAGIWDICIKNHTLYTEEIAICLLNISIKQ